VQWPANTLFVKTSLSAKKSDLEPPIVSGGSGPDRVTRLLNHLRSAIEVEFGRSLIYEELTELLGEPKSTLGNWFNGDGCPSPELLVRMLELLPVPVRQGIMEARRYFRSCPTLEHARLSHDPVAVSRIQSILREGRGTTLVHGDQDHVVTFVATALGHSLLRLRSKTCRIRGLDSHPADWFVPVPGVAYLQNGVRPQEVQQAAKRIIGEIRPGQAAMVLLNGLGPGVLEEVEEGVSTLARTSLVVVGEVTRTGAPPRTRSAPPPFHWVRVRLEPGRGERILAEVQLV
jgi:hypothetical protein